MKKRVLSLLLMVLMVVSAVPLLAFATAAATDEETVINYGELYVADGLLYAADFYTLNQIWGEMAPEVPESLSASFAGTKLETKWALGNSDVAPTKLLYADGRTGTDYRYIQFFNTRAEAEAKLTELGGKVGDVQYYVTDKAPKPTDEFKNAIASYQNALAAQLNGFAFRSSISGLGHYLAAIGPLSYHDNDGSKQIGTYEFGDGYLQFVYRDGQSYLTVGGLPSTGYISAEYVMGAGNVGAAGQFVTMRDIALSAEVDAENITFTQILGYAGITKMDFEDVKVPANKVLTLGITSDRKFVTRDEWVTYDENGENRTVVAEGTEGAVKETVADGSRHATTLFANGQQFFNGTLVESDQLVQINTLLGYGNALNSQMYAIRFYNRDLSAEERAINHFADIAKWYKLDPGIYTTLDFDQRAEIAMAFADDAIGGDAGEVDALQAKLKETMGEVVYRVLTEGDDSAEAAAFREIAKETGIEIAELLTLPVAERINVYRAVLVLTESQKKSTTMVQATVNAAIQAILRTNYGAYMPEEAPDYKELYVRQENLVLWMDFFAARATDGKLYMDYSYPEETWDVPHWIGSGSTRKWNENKLRVPEISGEAAARAKYVFKGDSYFEFGDIPDVGYGHTNIRTWGDGSLICGKNNVLDISGPGTGVPQVTYQIVADWNSAESGSNSPSFQLDGFRFNPTVNFNNGALGFKMNYYAYGGNYEGVMKNDAVLGLPTKSGLGTMQTSVDMTLTLDKDFESATEYYYVLEYLTDAEGNYKYSDNLNKTPAAKAGRYNTDLWRIEIDGVWYYVGKDTNRAEIACYYEDENGTVQYVTVTEGDKQYLAYYPVSGAGANRTVDTTPVAFETAQGAKDEAPAVKLNGPWYVSPPTTVNKETAKAAGSMGVGPIVYDGSMTFAAYYNGSLAEYYADMPYRRSDIGWMGNGANMTFYAVRTYNCVLTEPEIKQNHFADLAGYYGLDLTKYILLSDTQKEKLHDQLATYELGKSYSEGVAYYENVINTMLYDFDTTTAEAKNFHAICENVGLDIRAIAGISEDGRQRIYEQFADIEPTASIALAILQKRLADAVNAEYEDNYAAAVGHSAVTFEGWQVRLEGEKGLRALYSTDLSVIADLEARGVTVKTGVLMAPESVVRSLVAKADDPNTTDVNELNAICERFYGPIAEDESYSNLEKQLAVLRSQLTEAGTLVEGSPVTLTQGYWETGAAEGAEIANGRVYYTEEVAVTEDPDDPMAEYEKAYFYVGFAVLTETLPAAEGEDPTTRIAVFFEDTTSNNGRTAGRAQSLFDISLAARDDHFLTSTNIQGVLNAEDEDVYIHAAIGDQALSTFKFVIAGDTEAMEQIIDSVESWTAVRMESVKLSEATATGCIYLGTVDNIYGEGFYGISVRDGNLYLWYNKGATAADAAAYFVELFEAYAGAGLTFELDAHADLVRRVQ